METVVQIKPIFLHTANYIDIDMLSLVIDVLTTGPHEKHLFKIIYYF